MAGRRGLTPLSMIFFALLSFHLCYSGGASKKQSKALAAGLESFSWRLFHEALSESQSGNVVLSPMSVGLALAMLELGAGGETKEQIDQLLAPGVTDADRSAGFKSLTSAVSSKSNGYHLSVANALVVDKGAKLKKSYVLDVKNDLRAGAKPVDFAHEHEKVRGRINQWVAAKTNQKIRDLLDESAVDELTKMVVVNAVYFKADWKDQFTSENGGTSYKADFETAGGDKSKVDFMSRTGDYAYYEDDTVQLVGLPYKGAAATMYVVLPKEAGKLDSSKLTMDKVAQWTEKAEGKAETVDVHLPKFRISEGVELEAVLKKIGLSDMFDDRRADFSRMLGERVAVTAAVHKAYIEVSEKGTEAAAATGFGVASRSGMARTNKVFRANRPFAFFIKHSEFGRPLLFVGALSEPKAAQ